MKAKERKGRRAAMFAKQGKAAGEKRTRVLALRVTEDEQALLQQISGQQGIELSDLLRLCIRTWLDEYAD